MTAQAIITQDQPEAAFIAAQVTSFNVTDAAIAEMKENFCSIVVRDHTDRYHADVAHNRRMEVRKLRIEVEHKRKEMKEVPLRIGQAIDKAAGGIKSQLEEIEAYLQTEEDKVTKYEARMKAEAEAKKAAEQEAERQRVEALKREVEEGFAKLEAERRALEAEQERIEREKRHQEELAAEREASAKRAAFETEQRIQREAEAKAAREKAEAEAKARFEAARPDREKLQAVVTALYAIPMPEVESDEAKAVVSGIIGRIDDLAGFVSKSANKL